MEARHFDRLTRTVGTAGTRRGALVGLVAGTAALVGRGQGSRAKQHKKQRKEKCPSCPTCTHCPQRTCCACRAVKNGPPATCFTVEGWSQAEAQARCAVACGGSDLYYVATPPGAGAVNSCTADANPTCHTGPCPIPVEA
jgi:hypothetical protein